MLKTDCNTEFEVMAEGKYRKRIEIDKSQYSIGGTNPEFGFMTGFQNIKLEDGTFLKGINITLFFEE